jgi:23S rRNA (uracil1939-C5)-methyltransferase
VVLGRRESGEVVLAAGGIAGERVVVAVDRARRGLVQGHVVAVLEASPDRVEPPCPAVAAGCGGCDLQHLTVAAQPAAKVAVVVDALRRLGRVDEPSVVAGPALPAHGYRTTVRVGVVDGRAAFRRRASHDLLAVGTCLVAHPLVDEVLRVGRFDGCDEVIVRAAVATGERLVVAHPTAVGVHRVPADVVVVVGADRLVALDSEDGQGVGPDPGTGGVCGSATAGAAPSGGVPGDSPSDDAKTDGAPIDRAAPEAPIGAVHEEVAGRGLRISPGSFFQSRPDGAAALVDAVARAAGPALGVGGAVVDAYAGVGLFTSLLGGSAGPAASATWHVVERNPSAVADARHNLADLDARFYEQPVERWSPVRADVVIADPSRRGLGGRAASVLAATGAPVLVLVSCDPAALGRDAGLLAGHGFRLVSAEVVDLFAHTHHIEVVSRFVR